MTVVFADSYYFLALLNPRDAGHSAVVRWTSENDSQVVTSSFVLLEIADALSRPPRRGLAIGLVKGIVSNPKVEIVSASSEIFDAAWNLYEQRVDKNWSLTDCTSFVVMRNRGLVDALTADRHFSQAGFRALFSDQA
jgi:predicted nucleic acid-binding protein